MGTTLKIVKIFRIGMRQENQRPAAALWGPRVIAYLYSLLTIKGYNSRVHMDVRSDLLALLQV